MELQERTLSCKNSVIWLEITLDCLKATKGHIVSSKQNYDAIIVGAGPAGIFAAYELVQLDPTLHVALFEKGRDLSERNCPASKTQKCVFCKPCAMLSGWGGAGAFSDGKLVLVPHVGGWLGDHIDEEELINLIKYVEVTFLEFGVPDEHIFSISSSQYEQIQRKATPAGLELIPSRVRHIGTDRTHLVLKAMEDFLSKKIEIYFERPVNDLLLQNGDVQGVILENGDVIRGNTVILATGREGAEWLQTIAEKHNLETQSNPVDIGVRIEVPAAITNSLTDILYDFKFRYYSKTFDDMIRTFCVCPNGEVVIESYRDVVTVNGQSFAHKKTESTNFSLLVSTSFTYPFRDPIGYGTHIARLANTLSGGQVIVQRLADLRRGRRSTPERINRSSVKPTLKTAIPGDLSFVFPHRYLVDILEMLDALDQVLPGIASEHTLLYGTEVKFYSARYQVDKNLETEISNLYAVGDGAGITRSLVQAATSGVRAARAIIDKTQHGKQDKK